MDFNAVNETDRLFKDEHFRDGRHLNDEGAAVACAYFSDWFKNRLLATAPNHAT
jgi:hypothetical protein